MLTIGPGQPAHAAPLPAGPRVKNGANLAGSERSVCGVMPKMIALFKKTSQRSSATEMLLVGSSTTPSVRFRDVSDLRLGLPPIVIGNCVLQSLGSLLTPPEPSGLRQRNGSFRPGELTPLVWG